MTTTQAAEPLKPCPFCGAGETQIEAARGVWNGGLKPPSAPVSVSVRHWCTPGEGQPHRMIERIGRDEASAIAAWNLRAAPPESQEPKK